MIVSHLVAKGSQIDRILSTENFDDDNSNHLNAENKSTSKPSPSTTTVAMLQPLSSLVEKEGLNKTVDETNISMLLTTTLNRIWRCLDKLEGNASSFNPVLLSDTF